MQKETEKKQIFMEGSKITPQYNRNFLFHSHHFMASQRLYILPPSNTIIGYSANIRNRLMASSLQR